MCDNEQKPDEHFCVQGTSAHPRYYAHLGMDRLLVKTRQAFFDNLKKIEAQPKNPPLQRLSKKEFYELVKKEPWHLYTSVYDEVETLNGMKVIWLPLCEEPLPLEEII